MQGITEESQPLNRRQEAALLTMITCPELPLSDVARKISVNESTLWRWRQEERFIKRYRELRRAAVEQGIARIQSLFDKAVDCLERNLTSGNRPSEVRTAVSIIRQSLEGVDLLDHDNRILAIEKRFETPKGK